MVEGEGERSTIEYDQGKGSLVCWDSESASDSLGLGVWVSGPA